MSCADKGNQLGEVGYKEGGLQYRLRFGNYFRKNATHDAMLRRLVAFIEEFEEHQDRSNITINNHR